MKKDLLIIEPHPLKVLVKTTQKDYEELFFKWIKRDDGTQVQLFTTMKEDEGFDARYKQNVSVGRIVAVGDKVKNIFPSDLAILDYMVSNDNDSFVGTVDGDRMVSLLAETTYHTEDALPSATLRKAYVKGDYDELSKILGVIRNDKLISFSPYIFLTKEESKIVKLNTFALPNINTEGEIVERIVLSAFEGSGYKNGDRIAIKEEDLFFRTISGKEVAVCYFKEILYKK